jgi:hypothetical protein
MVTEPSAPTTICSGVKVTDLRALRSGSSCRREEKKLEISTGSEGGSIERGDGWMEYKMRLASENCRENSRRENCGGRGGGGDSQTRTTHRISANGCVWLVEGSGRW